MTKKFFLILLYTAIAVACIKPAGAVTADDPDNGGSPGIPVSLEQCVLYSVENNFNIKMAKLDYLISETELENVESMYDTILYSDLYYSEDRRENTSVLSPDKSTEADYKAGLSKMIPLGTRLDISFSHNRSWNNSQFVSINPAHTSQLTVEGRQPLGKNMFGYVDRRRVTATKLAIKNADLKTRDMIEEEIAIVEKAYWMWVFTKESLASYRKILERAKYLQDVNTRSYDLGRIEKGDFVASQANVVIRETDVRIAENRYKNAGERLKNIINMDADVMIYPIEELKYRQRDFTLEDCLREAFLKRRDYKESLRDIEIKGIVLQSKSNEMWPEIDLVGTFAANGVGGSFGNSTKQITSENNTYFYGGVEVSFPFEDNLAKSEYDKAKYRKEKSIIGLKKVERAIVTEVGNAYRDFITYEGTLKGFMEAERLQREKLDDEDKRFSYGRSDTKRLIDYQRDLLWAELDVSRGVFDFEVSKVDLQREMNILLEKYEDLL